MNVIFRRIGYSVILASLATLSCKPSKDNTRTNSKLDAQIHSENASQDFDRQFYYAEWQSNQLGIFQIRRLLDFSKQPIDHELNRNNGSKAYFLKYANEPWGIEGMSLVIPQKALEKLIVMDVEEATDKSLRTIGGAVHLDVFCYFEADLKILKQGGKVVGRLIEDLRYEKGPNTEGQADAKTYCQGLSTRDPVIIARQPYSNNSNSIGTPRINLWVSQGFRICGNPAEGENSSCDFDRAARPVSSDIKSEGNYQLGFVSKLAPGVLGIGSRFTAGNEEFNIVRESNIIGRDSSYHFVSADFLNLNSIKVHTNRHSKSELKVHPTYPGAVHLDVFCNYVIEDDGFLSLGDQQDLSGLRIGTVARQIRYERYRHNPNGLTTILNKEQTAAECEKYKDNARALSFPQFYPNYVRQENDVHQRTEIAFDYGTIYSLCGEGTHCDLYTHSTVDRLGIPITYGYLDLERIGIDAIKVEIVGDYENSKYDGQEKNNWHLVTISKKDENTYLWTNKKGVSWTLTKIAGSGDLSVGDDCPYKKEHGYEKAVVSRDSRGFVTSISGPFGEAYVRSNRAFAQ